jgi:hypothetical protein
MSEDWGNDPIVSSDKKPDWGNDPVVARQESSKPDESGLDLSPKSAGYRFSSGMMDPSAAAAQMEAHYLPQPALDAINWIRKNVTGAKGDVTPEGVDAKIKSRNKEIEAGQNGVDWARMGGNVVSTLPIAAVQPEITAAGAAGLAGRVGVGALAGAEAGVLQPTTADNFTSGKVTQAAEGGLFGAAGSAAGAGLAKGLQSFGSYLARNNPDSIMNSAVQKVLTRIGQDAKAGGPTAQDAMDLVEEANKAGKPMTLADVGGENVKGLAGSVARQPGTARAVIKEFLGNRDEGAAKRLSDDIDQYVSSGPTAKKTTEALFQARTAAARPLYAKAMDPTKIVDSPRIRQFLSDPTVSRTIKDGIESQRLEALRDGVSFTPFSAEELVLDANGVPIGTRGVPNMRVLDAVKRGLDSGVDGERDAITGRLSQRGTMLDGVRREFVKELDKVNPDYAAARAAWGGPSASLDAIKQGRTIFNRNPEQIASEFKAMSPGEQEAYRVGVADLLRERIGKTGFNSDEAKAIIKNAWTRDQLRPIFKSQADFDKFVDSVTKESDMYRTSAKVGGGEQATSRAAEDKAGSVLHGAINAGRAGMDLLHGNLFSAAHNAWRFARGLGAEPNGEFNEKIAKILFATDPKKIAEYLATKPPVNPTAGASKAVQSAAPYVSTITGSEAGAQR